ncbi:16S rRNA (adenine(1518)-N(6)/adenine(1519)-N(6))-dimethyltransferase RsmA [Synechococcus sp. CS-1332]|uniref:16S rRNA (adenine(1518)-N(6)/adenine(1519)-N(6))- dimethyltransferase RsmA n=1 Tax=Synechococcus sp. CS-1332 TaxID=2847972 RepID=UPI00223B1240|nr:16S rRNA (adenine(1518)-N(6)/adenine(1519)-N(6))-dimethyltransferase RsmA [Synechococcus sp. CS-1332]MCT0208100.1 16S rRNA (adenine(1518)-N(6)/adenine(1519)-N(6))-dimethyltransferase RsmA [Synechococcus sp. CS-1332]
MTFSGHRARKRFGQHWLTDPQILDRIVAAADLDGADHVLEVGPGRGALTERLLESPAASLLAVELDRDLVVGLRQRFGDDGRFSLIEGDVLELALPCPERPIPTKVVANIPYNITGPLLEVLVGRLGRPAPCRFERLVLLVQQEVGQRIRARPGSSAFSALSVRMQLLARCSSVCTVPPRCFSPPPKVTSEVIVIEPVAAADLPPLDQALAVESLLRRCFAGRRKMLRTSLAGLLPAPELLELATAAGVDLQQRPQELGPERWMALARALMHARGVDQGEGELNQTLQR